MKQVTTITLTFKLTHNREFLISGICPQCWDEQFGEG